MGLRDTDTEISMEENDCMKKLFTLMAAIIMLLSAAFADEPEADGEPAEITERTVLFFMAWNLNDPDAMLEMCDSGWKAGFEDPRQELLGILAGRTPLSFEPEAISKIEGESLDGLTYYMVTAVSDMDGNDGKSSGKFRFHFLVRKEEDGLWHVNPAGLETCEKTEGKAPAEAEPGSDEGTAAADLVLYYFPDIGEYYHLDQNCISVHPKYRPLQGSFLYAQVNDEPYRGLKPCEICGAPSRQEDRPLFTSFRDAVEAAGEDAAVGGGTEYLTVVAEKDGRYYRTVTILDDRAKELYTAAMAAADSDAGLEAFQTYAWSLPVCYTEEITEKPKDQAELDAQTGKTVGELLEEGYAFCCIGGGENVPIVADLSYGLFVYEFEVDASFGEYRENGSWEDMESRKVKSGKLFTPLCLATNLDYLADGTYQPQTVPHFTAGEAAAADSVPPLEEYSRKAWPLTAEGYSDLQNNMTARHGQVYMVEGIVHQVLSQNPERVILYTGEDGKSQPVVAECPGQLRFNWEAGSSCRIYAEVSSAFYTLPVLTARYTFSGPGVQNGPDAETEDSFEDVKNTVAGNIKTYREMIDGTWMCDGYAYQYRLEIKGRMPNAAEDSTFVYLSNIGEISFERAYLAAGISSDSEDYFSPEEAVLVEMN